MNCDNCERTALYYVNDPGANPVYYCGNCIPAWMRVRADEGHFKLPSSQPQPEEVTAPKKAKKSTDSAPTEDESN